MRRKEEMTKNDSEEKVEEEKWEGKRSINYGG